MTLSRPRRLKKRNIKAFNLPLEVREIVTAEKRGATIGSLNRALEAMFLAAI